MKTLNLSRNKKFLVYGLGITGLSVVKYLKKNRISNVYTWDDNQVIRKKNKIRLNNKNFTNLITKVDYIILSPGININESKFKNVIEKNKLKIITDLDLFYISNPRLKTIVVTGTNGKSTTCKIIEHLLKKNNISSKLGGNIGKPILSLSINKKSFYIIEASSFQLAYSKFIKPTFALILNITKDHLDWHGNMKNYTNSKLKIFSLQDSTNFAFLKDKNIINQFKKKKFLSKLKIIKPSLFINIKSKIKNKYLQSKINEENMSFVYQLSRVLKFSSKQFLKSFFDFKGLPHRHELFLKKNNIKFINDSKATSFESAKQALKINDNILWIVGGLPKIGDKFDLSKVKKKILKAYIIGKNTNYFSNQLKGKVKIKICKTLNNSLLSIFSEIQFLDKKKVTILFSPASASYDQYNNFRERGFKFKKLTKIYASRYF